jgi:stress-induced morphogen
LKIELTDQTIEKHYPSDVLNLIRIPPVVYSIGPKKRGKHAGKNTVKPTPDTLLECLSLAFPDAMIEIEDQSKWHNEHVDADHYRIRVLDARFNGLHRIVRHSLIYTAVSSWKSDQVYALNIIPMTLQEAAQAKDDPLTAARLEIEYVTNMFYVDC